MAGAGPIVLSFGYEHAVPPSEPAPDVPSRRRPETALLVVEIANSSLGYDLGRKASLYAQFGITELWVINAVTFETHIHRNPNSSQYDEVSKVSGDKVLHAAFAPELDVKLQELKLA